MLAIVLYRLSPARPDGLGQAAGRPEKRQVIDSAALGAAIVFIGLGPTAASIWNVVRWPGALAVTMLIFALIYYGLVHGNLPKRRPDDPGAGKAIGFMFIPFFNIYWVCFFWVRLCTRINDERARVGLAPTAPRGLVIAILCCYLGMFIPILNILAGIAIMVMLLIAIIQIQGSINGLAQTAGR